MILRCYKPTRLYTLRQFNIAVNIRWTCRICRTLSLSLSIDISSQLPWLAAERLSGMIPIKDFQTSVASWAPKLGAPGITWLAQDLAIHSPDSYQKKARNHGCIGDEITYLGPLRRSGILGDAIWWDTYWWILRRGDHEKLHSKRLGQHASAWPGDEWSQKKHLRLTEHDLPEQYIRINCIFIHRETCLLQEKTTSCHAPSSQMCPDRPRPSPGARHVGKWWETSRNIGAITLIINNEKYWIIINYHQPMYGFLLASLFLPIHFPMVFPIVCNAAMAPAAPRPGGPRPRGCSSSVVMQLWGGPGAAPPSSRIRPPVGEVMGIHGMSIPAGAPQL